MLDRAKGDNRRTPFLIGAALLAAVGVGLGANWAIPGDRPWGATFLPWHLAAGIGVIVGVGLTLVFNARTAAREGEQALRDSEALLRESQEVAGVGSYVLDVQGGTWSSSAVLDSIFGIGSAGDRSVDGWIALIHPDERQAMATYFAEEVIGRQQRFDREYRILRASDGAERWVHGVGRLELDASGQPLRMIGTIRDITAQRQVEIERATLQAQLLQAQKMESVGRLAGGVAHDFNNMLSAILGYAELAADHPELPEAVRTDLVEIRRVALRSAALTGELLAFARRQTIAPRVIDLNEAIEGLINMLRRLIGEDIELQWRPCADPWPVRMDPSQVNQVLANLCVNARDAIATVGHIVVETARVVIDDEYCATHPTAVPGEYVRLTVTDNGHGMERIVLDRLFEPYFTTKPLGEGTGLGLATVYGIVKQNDGLIDVTSHPGQGTTFAIHFPRYVGDARVESLDEPQTDDVRGRGTLLVVEDDPAILRVTAMRLVGLGYDVLAAATPSEALRAADEPGRKIDLVLTDVVMPEMHGRELVAALRRRRPDLACLYMSGYTADIIAHHGVLDDGALFIQKPFSAVQLGAKVKSALSSTKG